MSQDVTSLATRLRDAVQPYVRYPIRIATNLNPWNDTLGIQIGQFIITARPGRTGQRDMAYIRDRLNDLVSLTQTPRRMQRLLNIFNGPNAPVMIRPTDAYYFTDNLFRYMTHNGSSLITMNGGGRSSPDRANGYGGNIPAFATAANSPDWLILYHELGHAEMYRSGYTAHPVTVNGHTFDWSELFLIGLLGGDPSRNPYSEREVRAEAGLADRPFYSFDDEVNPDGSYGYSHNNPVPREVAPPASAGLPDTIEVVDGPLPADLFPETSNWDRADKVKA